MRVILLALLIVAACAEPVYAAEEFGEFTVTGRDLGTFIVVVGIPGIGVLWKVVAMLLEGARAMTLMLNRLDVQEKRSDKADQDRKEMKAETSRVEREARDGRSKLYNYVNAKMGGTPLQQE